MSRHPVSIRLRLSVAQGARRAYHRVAQSSSVRRIPAGWMAPVRARLFAIDASSVLEVVDALEAAGCQPCVAGGWGVDALLGRQTRRHADLDVIIDEGAVSAAKDALASIGFLHFSEGVAAGPHMPSRVVARDSPGHIVDLLPLDVAVSRDQALSAAPPFTSDEVVATGRILERPVRCLSPALQWVFHQGYSTRSHDRHDLARLRGTLGA